MNRLQKVQALLEKGDRLHEGDFGFAEKYFLVRTTLVRGRSAEPNESAISEYREKDIGYLVLISNFEKDSVKCLEVYGNKDAAESGFDEMKNDEDMYRLWVHSENAMDGKLFLAFVALTIKMELNRAVYSDELLRNRSVREIIDEMKLFRCTYVEGRRKPFLTEPTKLQKQVMKTFVFDTDIDVDLQESADDDEIDS